MQDKVSVNDLVGGCSHEENECPSYSSVSGFPESEDPPGPMGLFPTRSVSRLALFGWNSTPYGTSRLTFDFPGVQSDSERARMYTLGNRIEE